MNAPDKAVEIKAAITAIIAFGTSLWGATGWAIVVLFACIALDYLTGTFAAIHSGEWSSSVARQGLWHKLGEISALLVAALCDIALNVIINSTISTVISGIELPNAAFTMLVTVWYIFTELGSITENAAKLGAPVPAWLSRAIAKIKDKTEIENNNGSSSVTADNSVENR